MVGGQVGHCTAWRSVSRSWEVGGGRWEVGGGSEVGGLRFGLVRSQMLRFGSIRERAVRYDTR